MGAQHNSSPSPIPKKTWKSPPEKKNEFEHEFASTGKSLNTNLSHHRHKFITASSPSFITASITVVLHHHHRRSNLIINRHSNSPSFYHHHHHLHSNSTNSKMMKTKQVWIILCFESVCMCVFCEFWVKIMPKPLSTSNGFGVQLTKTISTTKWFWNSLVAAMNQCFLK